MREIYKKNLDKLEIFLSKKKQEKKEKKEKSDKKTTKDENLDSK